METKKKRIIILISFIVVGIILIMFFTKRNSFIPPKDNYFSLKIEYDKDTNTAIAQLQNKTNYDYNITVEGSKEEFIYLHVICDSSELPLSQELLLSELTFKSNSTIMQEFDLDKYDELNNNYQIYATAHFSITDPNTSEQYKFNIESNTLIVQS